jgi:hypothetical protein
MKILKNINSSDILCIDIETVRIAENYESLSDDFKSAWQYKNKQDGIVPDDETLNEKLIQTSSLYAEFSKVCAISLVYLRKGVELRCKSYSGTDEKEILKGFAKDVNLFTKANKDYRFLGHAAKYFDYPFLWKRYIINGLDAPDLLDESNKKPWDQKNICTNELWRSNGTGPGSSLQALCTCLNIPISKVDMVGDEVGLEYFKGNMEGIAKYCDKDAISTFNVFRFFKKEPIFNFEDVVYVVDENKKHPLVEEITKTKKFGKRTANKLVKEFMEESYIDKEKIYKEVEKAMLTFCDADKLVKNKVLMYFEESLGIIRESITTRIKNTGELTEEDANRIIKAFETSSATDKIEVVKNVEALLLVNNKKTQLKKMKQFEYFKEKMVGQ